MANVLTSIAPYLFSAAREVAAEPVGGLSSINMNFDSRGVAKGDSVIVPVAPVATEGDYTPAMTTTEGTSKTASSIAVTIDYSKETSWHLTGEQQKSLQNANSDKEWVRQMIAQGMRTLRNAAEVRLMDVIYQGASRAVGTAGTTPFASTIDLIPDVQKILIDNGAPMSDPYLIINTAAMNNLQKLSVVASAYAAGSDEERRQGIILKQYGFKVKVSAGIEVHTKGTATGFDCTAIEPVGETVIACDGSSSGTIVAGDIVTRGTEGGSSADGNKYVVYSGSTLSGASSGNFIINDPGLRVATAVNDEWTIGANYTPNVAFERNAVVGVWRPPLIPPSPLIKQIPITDEKTGMSWLLCEIVGDGEITWRLQACYGFKVINPEFIAILMG